MKLCAELDGFVDLLEIHKRSSERFPFLLQSVAAHPRSGRYDLLFGFPGARITGALAHVLKENDARFWASSFSSTGRASG